MLHCEDVPATELVRRWGTPLYVYALNEIRKRYRALEEALAPVPHLIAYAVKANGNLAILRTMQEMGAGADIVSHGEMHRARLAGIPADRIVFSGVGKTVHEIGAALKEGIYAFNVESEGELHAISDVATAMGTTANVALRVNPDVHASGTHEYMRTGHATAKFGIDINRARDIYRKAARMQGIRVRGVDTHIGSQILDVKPFQTALERLLTLVDDLRSDGMEPEFVDLGGGIGIPYGEDESGIDLRSFADAVVPAIRETGLRLVVEPGRFLVGPAGLLLTRVLYTKQGGGKDFVIADAGMNDLMRPSHYAGYHEIVPVEPQGREPLEVDVVGPICETGDFLARARRLESTKAGELLAVKTVGAYGFAMSSVYNQRPRAAEVVVDGGEATLARRRETLDDLVAAESEVELLDG